ncbi:MAG: HipA N-terminal domain-containing protein [Saprospiraceae bacterium]|nr:HipA N-terminal domain-containing protein [Saprospiraceae bacterium]
MRKAVVYYKSQAAGALVQYDDGTYTFCYTNEWLSRPDKPAISLNMPKSEKEFNSKHLFPFFYNMLAEGVNKNMVCRRKKIDENDDFGLLLATAGFDTIGAVTIVEEK